MLDFDRLTSTSYVFNSQIAPMSAPFARFFYVVFGLMIVVALAAKIMSDKKKKEKKKPEAKLFGKIMSCLATMGIVAFILLFFRQARVVFLSMPFLFYLWGIGLVVWVGLIFKWAKTRIPQINEEAKKREEQKKYLP
jgi:archaellum biogenesis protein FlaJ (TadC family)